MLRILVVLLSLIPLLVGGWGPITHLHIAHEQGYDSDDYCLGSILPDFSLAYRSGINASYPNLQSVTHSQDFVNALREVASEDFCNGWAAHLAADPIESAYSAERIALGAPEVADYVVDQAYVDTVGDCPRVTQEQVDWIDYALDAAGCVVDCPKRWDLSWVYGIYVNSYQPRAKQRKEILVEWYADYAVYVQRAIDAAPHKDIPPPDPPKPPVPPSILDTYYNYTYNVGLSKSAVEPGESFTLDVSATFECIKDFPIGIGTVTGMVDILANDTVILSGYVVSVYNFPDWKGDKDSVNESIVLSLPDVGAYTIAVTVREVIIDSMDVTSMIPSAYQRISVGAITCQSAEPETITRRARPWYDYEAPPERAEAEALKKAEWASVRAAMAETDDIAEKLRLYTEWEAFRDAHATPSERR